MAETTTPTNTTPTNTTPTNTTPSNTTNSEEKTLGTFSAVFLVGNAAIGAGILNFPEAFEFAGGPIMAMILQILVIVFVVMGLVALATLTKNLDCASLQDIMMETCGKGAQIFSIITIILYSFFCCVAYHVVIGDQFDRVFYDVHGKNFCHTWYLNRKCTIAVASTIFMLPFLFPKKIDFLKYISHVGVTAIMFVVFLVVYKYFAGSYSSQGVVWIPHDFLKVTMTIPPFCFAYHAHIQSVPVFWCMRDQSTKGQLFVCFGAMICCLVMYSLTGTFGYLTFGTLVQSNILSNYPADNALVIIALLIVALKICTVYPVVVFCGRDAIIDLYIEITKVDRQTNSLIRRVIVAVIWFTCAVALALLFPNIGIVIDVLGFFVAFFMFLFPGVALLLHNKTDSENKTVKYGSITLIVLGVIITIMSVAVVIWRLIKGGTGRTFLCS